VGEVMADAFFFVFKYRATDFVAPGPGKLQLVYTPQGGGDPTVMDVYDFKGKGVALSMYNTDEVHAGPFQCPVFLFCSDSSISVYRRICAFFIQDGPAEEDAPGALN
jgi:hypothetical protein